MLEFCDGFDHYGMILQKWDGLTVAGANNYEEPLISPTSGRNGGGAMWCRGYTGNQSTVTFAQKNLPNIATRIVGFAAYLDSGSGGGNLASDQILLRFMDAGAIQVDLRITLSGHLYFTRSGTVIGTQASTAISLRTWHYIEVKVTIDPSAGVANLNVDGVSFLTQSSLNTRTTPTSQTGAIQLGVATANAGNPTWLVLIDDVYTADTTGSFNNAFLGDVKVQGVLPTGNGSLLNYTKNEVAWVANQQVFVGRQIKDSNGNIQIVTSVTSDAKTGGSAPTWAIVAGNTTVDNHATWTMILAATDYLEVNQHFPEGIGNRINSTVYTVGQAVWDNNGNIQIVTTAGSSSGADILQLGGWNITVGGLTFDNTMVWTNIGLFEDLYLSDAGVGDIERFTFPNVTATTVQAVVVTSRARKDDPGVRSIRGATKSGGTTGDSGTDLVLSTSYQFVQGIFETDPNTSAAWTPANANSAEFGIKTTA